MAAFCGKCGSPLIERAVYCGGCGSPVPPGAPTATPPASPAASSPIVQPASPSSAAGGFTTVNVNHVPPSISAPPAAKTSNSLLKLVIVFVVIIFVGGLAALAAVYYAAHKVSEKIHAAAQSGGDDEKPAAGALSSLQGDSSGSELSAEQQDSQGPTGDLCRFLSQEDVSTSTGTTVIRANSDSNGCVYTAKGDPGDVLAKHMSGMVGQNGGDAQSQQLAQKIAGAFFQQQEQTDRVHAAEAKKGEFPVIAVVFSPGGHGVAEMKMNQKMMGFLGSEQLTGIGDEAFNSADGTMTVRKGNNMFRIMYIGCPCTIDAIKPLAQKIANAL